MKKCFMCNKDVIKNELYCPVHYQVFLDGNDTLWITSKSEGQENGQWIWPPRI